MASVQPGDCEHPSVRAQSLTCHDDMKDTGRPLFPHSVGGCTEEGAVVHGVPGGVAQPAHPALADSPHVGHPAHHNITVVHSTELYTSTQCVGLISALSVNYK